MPTYPDDVTLVRIRHTPVTTGGRILAGNLVSAVVSERVWGEEGSILPAEHSTTIQADGSWEIELPAVDSPGLRPQGAAYRITEHVPGGRALWAAPLVSHAPGPVDLADVLTPAPSPGGGITIQTGPATDASMAEIADNPDSQFHASLTGTIGTAVEGQVPPLVASAIADDDTIVQAGVAAVETAAEGLDIVTGTRMDAATLAAGRRDRAWTAVAAPAREVAIRRVSATKHELLQRIAGDRWVRWTIDRSQPSVGGDVQHIRGVDTVRRIMDAPDVTWTVVDDSESAFSFDPGWTDHGRADALGGRYYQSTVAGSVCTWQTPAATALRLRTLRLGNGGLIAITIDGDATAANLCETAAEWCARTGTTDGVLTTHTTPGTLEPDQRIVDCYGPTGSQWDAMVPVASDLTSVAHTVTITSTAYTTGSTDSRAYVSGGEYGTSGGSPVLTWTEEQQIAPVGTVWEYAAKVGPDDSTRQWVGGSHGHETQVGGLAIQVDGASATLTDGQVVEGATDIVLTRVSTIAHPTGGTGAATVQYRLTPDGLTITCHLALNFATSGQSRIQAPMLPLDNGPGGFTRGYTTTMPAPATVDGVDETLHGLTDPPADGIVLWQPTGHLAAVLTVPDLPSYPDVQTYIQGRDLAKGYVQRSRHAVPAGTPIRSVGHYRISHLTDPSLSLAY